MLVVRVRSLMWFTAGLLVAVLSVSLAWQSYAAPNPIGSTIVAVTPTRVLDTRDPGNLGLPGPFVSTVSQKLLLVGPIATSTGTQLVVPAGANGVLLNVTVVAPTSGGFLSIRPGDATGSPTTSSLNFTAGVVVPNAVQVAMPTTGPNAGRIDITFSAFGVVGPVTDVLIDVVGYTSDQFIQSVIDDVALKAYADEVYTKAETDAKFATTGRLVLSTASFTADNQTADWAAGCVRANASPFAVRGAVQLPVGVTITSLTGYMFDGDAALNSSLVLWRTTVAQTNLGSLTTLGSPFLHTLSMNLVNPEVVQAGEYFFVEFTGGNGTTNHQICGVEIGYTIPGSFSVLSSDTDQQPVDPDAVATGSGE